jgi:4-amino-4-deoxy-L-arabinose transferase-like glycosyltransferase
MSANMRKELSHDEHMYVAGGYLLARALLAPYRDFPYLQMPGLAFAYTGVFLGTDHLLLAARLFNTVCGMLSALVLFFTGSHLFRAAGYPVRFLAAAGSVVLLIANPIFLYSSGVAWNHDLPVLLVVLAASLFWLAHGRTAPSRLVAAAGLAVGLAISTRLAFAPVLLPFAVAALFLPGASGQQKRLYMLGAFAMGVLVGLLPAVVTAGLAPDRFLFDNVRYHGLSEVYWRQLGNSRAMSLPGKLAYLWEVVREPGSLEPALGAMLFALLAVAASLRAKGAGLFQLALVVSLALCLAVGALGPTPTWYQYYYPPIPFVVLGLTYGASILYASGRAGKWGMALFALIVLAAGAAGLQGYARLNPSLRLEDWVPSQVHRVGLEIKGAVGRGRVLTLAPLFPLEGGAGIYEQLAAGPFTWRVAGQLPAVERQRLGVVGGDDLAALLGIERPAGILTGLEVSLEGPLVEYAQAHGYRARQLSNGATLWLPGP